MSFTGFGVSRIGGAFRCLSRFLKKGAVGHTGIIMAMSFMLSVSSFAKHLFKRENVGYAKVVQLFQLIVKASTCIAKGSGLNEQYGLNLKFR